MNSKLQRGFTLIELVIVIVLLGILAATALPRLANFTTDARTNAVKGVRGGLQSAINVVHAAWLVQGQGATVTLEGATTVVVNTNGWPTIDTANGAQDTAAKLFALLMNGPVPDGWTSAETAAANAGTGTYTLRANCLVSYDGANGQVTNTTTGC